LIKSYLSTKGNFDWYAGWPELKEYLLDYMSPESNILMVGCGNSRMSEHMYKDNFKNITNIDISNVVVDKMKNSYNENFEKMICNYF
jgi:2-polyprenyl-3-methyl-5-hydroxy-6-metoxy-1,4-benzoquinol methylase